MKATQNLLFAFTLAVTSSAPAATTLLAVWQEDQASAGHSFFTTGGFPSTRSLSDSIQLSSAFVTQTASFGGLGFQFAGRVTEQNGGGAHAYQYFYFDITGQNETVSFDLSTFSGTFSGSATRVDSFTIGIGRRTGTGVAGGFWDGPVSQSFTLGPGNYYLIATALNSGATSTETKATTFADSIGFTNLGIAPGAFQNFPLVSPNFSFSNVPSRRWFDPPTATEFAFQMTDTSLFTEIMNLPTGFDAPFEVLTDNTSLGFFTPDQSVNFTQLIGHGVSSFAVRNITPGVDPASQTAFPIQLAFNTETASFTMSPAPEPSSIILLTAGTISLACFRRRTNVWYQL